MKEDLVAQESNYTSENTRTFVFDFRKKSELEDDIDYFRDAIEIFQNLRYRYSETLWWYERLPPAHENEEVKRIVDTCNKKMADYDRLIELMQEYEMERRNE